MVSSRDLRASVSAVVPNPEFAAPVADDLPVPSLPGVGWAPVIALLVFCAVSGLALGVLLLMRPEPNTLRQLEYYRRLRETAADGGDAAAWDEDSVRAKVMRAADTVASQGGASGAIRQELERAGLPLRATEYMVIHVLAVLIGGSLVQIVGGRLIVTFATIFVLSLGPVLLTAGLFAVVTSTVAGSVDLTQ